MSARPDQVFHEILARGFRGYPRGIVNGFVFAIFTVAFVWQGLPHEFLLVWFAVGLAVAAYRLSIARAFLRVQPTGPELNRWGRKAAIGYGGTRVLWGSLGGACIHFPPHARAYILGRAFLNLPCSVPNMPGT